MIKEVKFTTCPLCGERVNNTKAKKHIISNHSNLSDLEKSKLWYDIKTELSSMTSKPVLIPEHKDFFIEQAFKCEYVKTFEDFIKIDFRQVVSFYKVFIEYKGQITEDDVLVFFTSLQDYIRKCGRVNSNSTDYAIAMMGGDEEKGMEFYNNYIKPKNRFTGHGSDLSPFSEKFVGYEKKSDPEAHKKFLKTVSEKIVRNTKLQYYLNKGLSEEEARKALSERQSTFSLRKCINKYGLKTGVEVFNDRQVRWQHSLNSNPESKARQEAGRLKATKVSLDKRSNGELVRNGKLYSDVSQRLFNILKDQLGPDFEGRLRYGECGGEYRVDLPRGRVRYLDFYVPDLKKCIEFDGEYWHNENAKSMDKVREKEIGEVIPGIQFYRVDESVFLKDPDKAISDCLSFLNS